MQALKEELSSEEKFFESAVKTERFVKKYKKPMIASVIVLLLGLGGSVTYQIINDAKVERANTALNTLLMNPMDQNALKELSSQGGSLYELYSLSKALRDNDLKTLQTLKGAKSFEVADIASYESAVLSKDEKVLDAYSKKQGSMYQELAVIELAVLSIQKGVSKAAHISLALIKEDSAVYPLAQMLSHYGVK
jgi:predicted negative regulator of RcsB-dependent stress response